MLCMVLKPSPRPEKQAPTPSAPQDDPQEQVADSGQHVGSSQRSRKANGYAGMDEAAEHAHAQTSPRPLAPATIHVTKSPRRATSPLHVCPIATRLLCSYCSDVKPIIGFPKLARMPHHLLALSMKAL